MKTPLLLLVILSTLIILSCKTIEYVEVPVLIKPEIRNPPLREELSQPETIQDLGNIILYYEIKVQEWESWGISVYESMDIPLPESLKKAKQETEDVENTGID